MKSGEEFTILKTAINLTLSVFEYTSGARKYCLLQNRNFDMPAEKKLTRTAGST